MPNCVITMDYRPGLKYLLTILLLALLPGRSIAQVAYHNFNSNDGLPSNEVYCGLQDHDGFLWFGTDHGVVKYNGYNFKIYTTADGLTDNTVLDLKEDDNGKLWVLTFNGGLCFYDGSKFAPHPNNDTLTKLCSRRSPNAWEVMQHNEVWLALTNDGFYRVNNTEAESLSDKTPNRVNDSMNIYIIRLNNGKTISTVLYGRKMKTIVRPKISSFSNFTVAEKVMPFQNLNFSLYVRNDGSMLLNQWNYLLYINQKKESISYRWSANVQTYQIRAVANGKVWLTGRNMPTFSLSFNHDSLQFIDSFQLSKSISNLLLDHQGNYWLTSLDKGIFMIPNEKVHIFSQLKSDALDKVTGLAKDSKNLYATLPEGKLFIIDTLFKGHVQESPVKIPGPASAITFRQDGSQLSNQDSSFDWFSLKYTYITHIIELTPQRYLIGTLSGLYIVDHKTVIFESLSKGMNKRISSIAKTGDNDYAIGTVSGLYYLSLGNEPVLKEEPLLANIRITSIKTGHEHIFGIATRGKGIYIHTGGEFYNISEKNHLISNLAEDVYFENDSLLWVATFKGLSKVYIGLKKESLSTKIKNYSKEDGLCSNQINNVSGFNGAIWLATNEGLCYFNQKDLTEDTAILPLYFGAVSVNGTKRSSDSLVMNYYENNVLIEFNALYFKAIDGIRYKVRLNNIGPWKYTGLNYIQYFNLPPGEYHLQVAAEDGDGKYKSDIHTLTFIIKPKFTDTVFFKILLGILVLLIAGGIISTIFSYQKLKSTNVIKLLQAEFKALSYQINPHFIFNVLNSIQYYILKKDTDNAVHLLGSFALLIRRIVNNSRQQYISIIEEVECLREYMDLEKMRLDNRFDYSINIDSNIDIEEKNILPMIIQPLVENSIWHGIVPGSAHGIISVDFRKENDTIICVVEDNGVGINAKPANAEKNQNNLSLAMKNVSERLKIISELNDSTWAIKTEDKSVKDPMLHGTIVTIIFPAVKNKI